MSKEFSELTAIVTGGASGIGAAVVSRLLEEGARVAVLDLDVAGANPAAFAVRANVADEESVREAVGIVASYFGGIDVVVNNAGIGAQGTIEANSDSEWARVFNVNVTGIVRVTREALPYLRQSAAASVVNTCSIAATAGLPERALYSAPKGAVLSLTRAMAADHLREGIRVNCVNPGTADTPWIERLLSSAADPAAEREALNARQPHGRLVSADEIADAVLYLASPRSRSTTGTSLAVDGGMQGTSTSPEPRMSAVKRFVQVVNVKPEMRDEYLRLHAEVWPAVEATIRACNLTNYSIFILGNMLIGYFEYVGDDFEKDMARMAADPITQEWWSHTDPCQIAVPEAGPGELWTNATEVWHLA